MLDGTYSLEVDTPLGTKTGKVILASEGSAIEIAVDAPIVGKQRLRGQVQGDAFTAHDQVKVFPLGKVNYEVEGRVFGANIILEIRTSKGNLHASGIRL